MPIGATKPPGNPPRWATNGGTQVEPSSGQKDTGWISGQRPPFSMMNWLQGQIYLWQQYLEDATDELDIDKIDRDGSVTMAGNFLPDADGTRALGSSSFRFDAFINNLNVNGDILPSTTGVDLGSAGARFDAFLRDVTVSGSASPSTNGLELGTVTERWNAKLQYLDITGEITGNPTPAANAQDLGTTGARWDAFLETVTVDVSLKPRNTGAIPLGDATHRWQAFLDGATIYNTPITPSSDDDPSPSLGTPSLRFVADLSRVNVTRLTFPPGTTQTLNTNNPTVTTNESFITLDFGASAAGTVRFPTGSLGQIVVAQIGTVDGGSTATFVSGATEKLTLDGALVVASGNNITLIWTGSRWTEISRTEF